MLHCRGSALRATALNRCAIAEARLGRGALTRAEIVDSEAG
jgi:hypothetical protein